MLGSDEPFLLKSRGLAEQGGNENPMTNMAFLTFGYVAESLGVLYKVTPSLRLGKGLKSKAV